MGLTGSRLQDWGLTPASIPRFHSFFLYHNIKVILLSFLPPHDWVLLAGIPRFMLAGLDPSVSCLPGSSV